MNNTLLEFGPLSITYPSYTGGEERVIRVQERYVVKQNQLLLLSGDSGCGKSTLLSLFKGIIPHHLHAKIEGECRLNGHDLIRETGQEQVVYVFQNPYAQLVCSTVKEDLVFTMENLRFAKKDIAKNMVTFGHFFDLFPILEQKSAKLSGGECQKLVLAASLAANPTLLLLDEPTAFLDVQAREEFYRYLLKLKGHYTIILVDHHKEEVLPIVDHVINFPARTVDWHSRELEFPFINRGSNKKSYEISLQEVSFSYTKREPWLLEKFSMSAKSGEVVAIMGKNGVGKTTLFKLIAGVLSPQKGAMQLLCDGKKVLQKRWHQHLTYLMQNPESHFIFDSIVEECAFNSKFAEKELRQLLSLYLGEDIDVHKSPFLLSEGEKRRLTFIMAILEGKDILLYDEPTFGQDEYNKIMIGKFIREMKQQGKLQIMITHDQKLATAIADKIINLEK
ncbi:MAG: ABC transporter ATP-binding protein [Oligoflexia bacterium]|nr:ABC transporter ATP-binding protein [Oligoflexia bacterium]